ncbi:MAG: DUF2344 domain-containing protein [Spirochaetales bacterium]|nr:DUF2344 domain-containing protein [Spirochaetales bacterium]
MNIIPEKDLAEILLSIEKPGRYTGGEFGSVKKDADYTVAVSYPDLYEIGMSNLAVKLLYARINAINTVRCERVFAPKQDFREALRQHHTPLYTLESGIPLCECDTIAFSMGYELTATNALMILDAGYIPFRAAERGGEHPIVIAGGPGITNPAPFADFFDAVYIGEADEWLAEAFSALAALKKKNASKQEHLALFSGYPSVWTPDKNKAVRAVWTGFGESSFTEPFPVPSIQATQDHGVVEIMRGCPNGCRFCNAGFIYRPFRAKPISCIHQEVFLDVFRRGYREISLSSLSSGDYPDIESLLEILNNDFSHLGISFSLPSLRINTFALSLFAKIKTVRKSGLTFAVETPLEETQKSINKIVSLEKTVSLLKEAKKLGWKQAKFYFMIGLPGFIGQDETEIVASALNDIQRQTNMQIHVNFSTFVPKPHTPLQWCAQIDETEALRRIMLLQKLLPRRHFKISYHSPFQSFLEGMIGRGDHRAGKIIEHAFLDGACFDSWDDQINRDIWRNCIAQADWDVQAETCRKRMVGEPLPWQNVSPGVSMKALEREYSRNLSRELSPVCTDPCVENCGVCSKHTGIKTDVSKQLEIDVDSKKWIEQSREIISRDNTYRILFSFSKTGKAEYLSHLNIMHIFEQAFQRGGFFCRMTKGFNPKPVLEFAHPLSLGIASTGEIAVVNLLHYTDANDFIQKINTVLPEGIQIRAARQIKNPEEGEKKHSLMSCYWGADYEIHFKQGPVDIEKLKDFDNIVSYEMNNASQTLKLRLRDDFNKQSSLRAILKQSLETDDFFRHCTITRLLLLAKLKNTPDCMPYFDLFTKL